MGGYLIFTDIQLYMIDNIKWLISKISTQILHGVFNACGEFSVKGNNFNN